MVVLYSSIQEEHAVMAMSLNAADTLVLLNVANQGVHLWDIRESKLDDQHSLGSISKVPSHSSHADSCA